MFTQFKRSQVLASSESYDFDVKVMIPHKDKFSTSQSYEIRFMELDIKFTSKVRKSCFPQIPVQ